MVDQVLRHIQCDRCGTGWTGPAIDQPADWYGLIVTQPVLAAFEQDDRQHLCPRCSHLLGRFLNNKHAPRDAGGARQ